MADLTESLLQNCVACGALLDVSDEEPFALMHCPSCGAEVRVRVRFGSFELQEVLGAGGMGSVYRALDVNLNRHVALKLLRRDYSNHPEFTRQFEHEAAITARINHPNVVKVYSSGSDNGLFYIAMELVGQGSLDELMTRSGRVPEMQVLDVGIHIAQGLNAALERGLIHRDVKPGNILFADGQNAKIVDFGLAVPVDQAGTIGGDIWGTPYYVAPEKLDNRPEDFRSDMYSLGATLFHAIAGRPAHDSDDASIRALKEVKSRPVSLRSFAPDVSKATAYAIDRSLHNDPDQRFQSYDEFIKHLEAAKAELRTRTKAAPATKRVPASKTEPKRELPWTMLGMATAIALGGAAVFAFRDQIFIPANADTGGLPGALQKAASFEESYQAGRQQLIAGQTRKAAAAFRELESQPDVPEPLRSWAGFHAALAWTLTENLQEARQDWQRLIDRGAFSTAPEDQKLAEFFLETARRASDRKPHPESTAEEYSEGSYEPVALLTFAAKNGALGRLQEAEALFSAFQTSAGARGAAWVKEYEPLAASRIADLKVYARITEVEKSATTPEQKKTALPLLKSALTELKQRSRRVRQVEAQVKAWEDEIAAYDQQETRKREAQEAADARTLADAQVNATPLTLQYRFSEARIALARAAVTSEKGRREQEVLMKRADWLSQFKLQLIKDLAPAGYPAPIQKRGGGQLTGVSRGTDGHLEIKTPYGSLPVPWSDIAHESIFEMAHAFVRPDLPAEQQANRKWLLGVYALFAGKTAEGRALLEEAAQSSLEYQQALPALIQNAGRS